jgi:hypothetical protein
MSSPYIAAHHSILAVELPCHGQQFLLLQFNQTLDTYQEGVEITLIGLSLPHVVPVPI